MNTKAAKHLLAMHAAKKLTQEQQAVLVDIIASDLTRGWGELEVFDTLLKPRSLTRNRWQPIVSWSVRK